MADRSTELAQICRMSCQLAILGGQHIRDTCPVPERMIAETIRIAVNEVLGYIQNARKKLEGRAGFSMMSQADLELLLAEISRKYGSPKTAARGRG